MARALLLVLVLGCVSCDAPIPDGRFACAVDEDCPDGWYCRGTAAGGRCSSEAPDPLAPAPGSLRSLGARRSDGDLTLDRDGFESLGRRCTHDGALCITGSILP